MIHQRDKLVSGTQPFKGRGDSKGKLGGGVAAKALFRHSLCVGATQIDPVSPS